MSVRDLHTFGCSSQQPTRYRNHGAYLLRWNGEGFLFDPGEGTQRQFIFANVAPPSVTRIFVSHFHGDHCLGLGSMLMRLNLDKVRHPIHCYYPASGKKYFDRLRYGTIYHETIHVVEHPVEKEGLVHDDGQFRIEAAFLDHGVDNVGWRVTEADVRKFDKRKLESYGIRGHDVGLLSRQGFLQCGDKKVVLDDVSWVRPGESMAVIIDTRLCPQAYTLAHQARLLLCESTYLEEHREMAYRHYHLTARQAASIALKSQAEQLILTHFSARYQDNLCFKKEAETIFSHVDVAADLRCFDLPRKQGLNIAMATTG